MTDKIYELVAKVMSVPISTLNDQAGPENIEEWDSFNGLVLVDELESEFNVQFTLDEIINVKKISDIKKHLKNHGVNL